MDNLCLHNLKIRTTKMNLHRKYIAPIVTELIIPSQLVKKKHRDDADKREAYARSKSPQ